MLRPFLLTALLTTGEAAHAADEVFIGFDLYNDLATNITAQGVSFAGATVLACGASLNCLGFPPFSGRNVIYDSSNGTITATFDRRVTGVISSVSARITGNTGITMTAYDASGQVIASKNTGGANYVGSGSSIGPNLKLALTSTQDRPIVRVTFSDHGNTFTVDDFSYVGRPTAFLLDPGHGRLLGDDGQWHYQRPASPAYALREDNLTLTMAQAAKEHLIANGYSDVYLTRTTDRALYSKACGTPDSAGNIDYCNEDLKLRIAYAKKLELEDNKRTIVVSVHTNGGFINRIRYGRTQAFWCEKRSEPLASKLLTAIQALIPKPTGSVLKDCGKAILTKSSEMKIPGALIEVLYHSDSDDEALLNISTNLTAYGKAIGSAAKAYAEEH
ncbi:MAG TPA: N-acetylmuramoyl-L-alanine amidase [Nitrospira sp.]|nr:N-acetylmuramoyl-L-alanine amidase [Nitrospira sp.]